jgi:membrane-bound lytic murein transglycosylase D
LGAATVLSSGDSREAFISLRLKVGGIVVAYGVLGAACAHAPAEPPKVPAVTQSKVEDPTPGIIAAAEAHLAAGRTEAKDGHLNKARQEFDAAVDAYLSAPGGAFANPKLADAYRRTVDEVHARELEALSAGDGFSERMPEPASIDEVAELPVPDTPVSEESRKTAEQAVEAEANDFPVELNNAVLSCVELYQGKLRDWFTAALSRGGRYLPQIRQIFASEGVPQDLAYVALVESAFHTGALSRAKAKGVWQFVADTGRRYGLQQDWWVDERSDPEKATRAAAKYLKALHELFGDWNLALAGYNAGELVVQRGLSRYGNLNFWELCRTRTFRQETRNYVPLIHAAIVVAKAPEKYGFAITPEPAMAYETVPVAGAVDLRTISECAQTTIGVVQELNPSLRRLTTPANGTFDLRVPPGAGLTVIDCLKAIPVEKRARFRTHVVARGQTLSTIAARYGVPTKAIAAANGIPLGRPLSVGAELIIPISAQSAVPAAPRPAVQATASAPESAKANRISYVIKPGDTLGTIASQYGTTVENLEAWNGLRTTRIAAGEVLTIFTSRKF